MNLSESSKVYYAVLHKLSSAAFGGEYSDEREVSPEERLWFAVIAQSVRDYYDCGVAQTDLDRDSARHHLYDWMWGDNIFGFERSWFLKVVEDGRRKIDGIQENRRKSLPLAQNPIVVPRRGGFRLPIRSMVDLFAGVTA